MFNNTHDCWTATDSETSSYTSASSSTKPPNTQLFSRESKNFLSTQKNIKLSRFPSHFEHFWSRHKKQIPKKKSYCGFENLGNTCYISSALQCLLATRLFSDYFYYEYYNTNKKLEKRYNSSSTLLKPLSLLIQRYRNTKGSSSINVSDLKRLIAKLNPMFDGHEQHDAQEFLAFLLDSLHENLNQASKKEKRCFDCLPEDPLVNRSFLKKHEYELLAALSWQKYLLRNRSFIVDLLQGQLESRITCLRCHDFSLKFEPFLYLSLPIKSQHTPNSIQSLKDAFKAFCSPERLKDAQWHCPNCKHVVSVDKQIRIIKLPTVLIIHLKRFEYDGYTSCKIQDYIHILTEGINFETFICQKHCLFYDLYAVIDHSGEASSGHYTASCLLDGHWLRFNDTLISVIQSNMVITSATYVLFLVRRDVPKSPELLLKQNMLTPENWPHSLSKKSIDYIKNKKTYNTL
ncbi:ubiquitin carboxyl-terminal hydrolase 4-like [Hylaeus volcanicus]|uniref:ubiquitin carboxyl-terminal hydrolase 4-like n=1 Tax=Hylaeus volcanicus TaxID=313075 RepID=UPI0023B78460|nr:ubiquitin carboxyl-terminal hydrolase 4-like [Hylaeus volcanicus]XP_053991981.1 ubiquitin carboxyl-terminal hydrolase 4-like [Hylaeus volcanicus]XP_053991982.1 ubiquitin carboxyl-terminal hydrolase 4-like [Hylaeus volcanicus]